ARVVGDEAELRRDDLDRDARPDEMCVPQRLDRDLLLNPALAHRGASRDEPRLAEIAAALLLLRRVLDPAAVDDVVQGYRAPVLRPRRRLDLQHDRLLAREVEARVVRIPDVADGDRLRGARVEVPRLPVDEGLPCEGG